MHTPTATPSFTNAELALISSALTAAAGSMSDDIDSGAVYFADAALAAAEYRATVRLAGQVDRLRAAA